MVPTCPLCTTGTARCRIAHSAVPGGPRVRRVARARRAATGGRRRSSTARHVVPDRRAVLEALATLGHRTPPGPVLATLGLVEPDPLPTGRGRWHGTTPETVGAVIFEDDGWSDLAVRAILTAALALEPAPVRPALALVRGFG